MFSVDPLSNPEPLIRRVYAYVASRIGDGPDAEDITSEVFERALRYRGTYKSSKGEPVAWLVGIARRCVDDALRSPFHASSELAETPAPGELEEDALHRLALAEALAGLEDRDRELIALRYGADLTARQIAKLLGSRTNAIEVALTRARARLAARLNVEAHEPRASP